METPDEEIMLALRSGDREALRILMDRYQSLLVNHFRRRGVIHQYEDLAQETFFRIYKARRRYRPTAKFRTWMFTIAERVWIDYVRKSARRRRREDAFREEPRTTVTPPPSHQQETVLWALDQLDRPHRDVLVLSYFDGLSHQEIATLLGIPEGTVKSRRHHAMKQLRDLYSREPLS